jgi:hypothetical protein
MRTERPTLRITRWLRSTQPAIPIEAECSACPNGQFKIPHDKRSERTQTLDGPPDRDRYSDILQRQFEEHLRSDHADKFLGKTLGARIRFLTPVEGGRRTMPRSRNHLQLKLGDLYTSCYVRALDGQADEWFELGKEYDVRLELLFPEHYSSLVPHDGQCELYEGSHLVARGRFLNGQRIQSE